MRYLPTCLAYEKVCLCIYIVGGNHRRGSSCIAWSSQLQKGRLTEFEPASPRLGEGMPGRLQCCQGSMFTFDYGKDWGCLATLSEADNAPHTEPVVRRQNLHEDKPLHRVATPGEAQATAVATCPEIIVPVLHYEAIARQAYHGFELERSSCVCGAS